VNSGNFLPTFQDNLSVPSSGIKSPHLLRGGNLKSRTVPENVFKSKAKRRIFCCGGGGCNRPQYPQVPSLESGMMILPSLGKHATGFQADVYAILACEYEIQTNARPEKYVSICSDSQAALKSLHAAKMSPSVRQCQKALNYICTWHIVLLCWVPGHSGV
jgi:hypothetical protein